MASDLANPVIVVAALAVTYLVHSTILIGLAWTAIRVFRLTSPALCERLWKGAAVAGLLTTPLQFLVASEFALFVIPVAARFPDVAPQSPEVVFASDVLSGSPDSVVSRSPDRDSVVTRSPDRDTP